MEYYPVPASSVQLAIPVSEVVSLPPAASFSGRSGQANLDVSYVNDTLYIYAVCDSLQRRVEWYEMELNRTRLEMDTQLEIEQKNAVQTLVKWFLIGALTGALITALLIIFIKK